MGSLNCELWFILVQARRHSNIIAVDPWGLEPALLQRQFDIEQTISQANLNDSTFPIAVTETSVLN